MMYHVMIIEDDPMVASINRQYVEATPSFQTDRVFKSGTEALEYLKDHTTDLIILDYYTPLMNGDVFIDRLHAMGKTPAIIMVTSANDREIVRSLLSRGELDYLVKPFSPRELVARVRALLRRVHADSEPQREVLEFGELTIDVSGHKVLVKGKEVDLTASEFKRLTTLSRYPGRVYSRMELVEKVLGYDFEGYERTIDSHVKNLRAKIGDNPRNPKWLPTVHGVGYRFEDPTKQ